MKMLLILKAIIFNVATLFCSSYCCCYCLITKIGENKKKSLVSVGFEPFLKLGVLKNPGRVTS